MTRIFTQTSHTITEDGLTASTVQVQGEVPLKSDNNIVVVVANDNDVVTLAPVDGGLFQRVLNAGANILQIFPAAGDDLGNGINNSTTLSPDDQRDFLGLDEVRWRNLTPSAIGQGVVVGPNTATDNALVRFDGVTGKLIKNSVGILSNTGSLLIAQLESNVTPRAGTGFIRMGKTDSIAWRNNAGVADVSLSIDGSDNLLFNGLELLTTTTGLTNPLTSFLDFDGNNAFNVLQIKSNTSPRPDVGFIAMGSTDSIHWRNDSNTNDNTIGWFLDKFEIAVDSFGEYSFSSTEADWSGNNLVGIGGITSSTTPVSGTGFFRMGNADTLSWRNNAGNGDLSLSVDVSDNLTFAGIQFVTSLLTSDLDFNGNNALKIGFVTSNVTPVAGTGFLRMAVTDNITWRNNGGVGDLSLSINNSDKLVFNGIELLTSATALTNPLTVDLDFNGNGLTNVGSIESDAALPALVGKIRLGNTEAVAWRNPSNDGDISLLANTANFLLLTNSRGIQLENDDSIRWTATDQRRILNDSIGFTFAVEGDHIFEYDISLITEYQYSQTQANFFGNNLVNVGFYESNAPTPSSIGTIRLGNSEIIAWRDAVNTSDVSFGYGNTGRFAFTETDRTVIIDLSADHTAPAADVLVGQLVFKDFNSIGTTKAYAQISSNIVNPLNGSERGSLTFDVADGALDSTFFVLNEGDRDSIVIKKALDLQKIDAPPDPPIEEGRLFVSTVNGANNGLFVKIKQNNSIVEVQIA